MIPLNTTRFGFTIIELLVTITLIVILVSAMVLGMKSARTAAQIAETTSRLMALKQATVWFKEEIGYLPPVLDDQRNLKSAGIAGNPLQFPPLATPGNEENYRSQIQGWYSITSPADFFLGYGGRYDDGFGRVAGADSTHPSWGEMPRMGIRHPGIDGVWRGTDIHLNPPAPSGSGLRADRRTQASGKIFGPYLDVNNDQMLGRILVNQQTGDAELDPVTNTIKVYYPGEPGYDIDQPMVIVDSWGTPIRYYRPLYPFVEPNIDGDLRMQIGVSKSYPPSNSYIKPTLSDYIVLRPFDFPTDKVIDGFFPDFSDGNVLTGDTSTSIELQTGQFAYLSSGPDKKTNDWIRADVAGLAGPMKLETDEFNKDNMVEVGP
jgi:prepilin-type N-terminal cleavage/methylation domain-containing protein